MKHMKTPGQNLKLFHAPHDLHGSSLYTRREWAGVIAAGLIAVPHLRLSAQSSRIAGVRVGTQSYSFRSLSLDQAIAAMRGLGLSYCELWSGHSEARSLIPVPEGTSRREATRKWRLDPATLDYFKDVRRRFNEAGITLTSYDVEFRNSLTDEEISRIFELAAALGVNVVTSSAQVSVAPRLEPFAAKANMTVGFHNHSNFTKDEFTTPEDFATALKAGPHMAMTLDIGHFTAAGFDALAFLDEHHDRVVALHIKDSKHKQKDSWVPFGEGDAKVADVLRRIRDRKWDIPAHIEFEYKGDTLVEMKRLLDYCRQVLEAK